MATAPRVTISETDASQFVVARGAVMAVVGPASKGPLQASTLIRSKPELVTKYGFDLATNDALALCRHILDAGGKVRFSRSVQLTNSADFSTRLSVASTISVNDDGTNPLGAVQTTNSSTLFFNDGDILTVDVNGVTTGVPFNGVAASVDSTIATTWDFTGGAQLLVKVDRGSVQEVNISAGDITSAGGVVAAVTTPILVGIFNDGRLANGFAVDLASDVQLVSDLKGSDSYVEVTGGTMNTLLGFPTSEQASAGPNTVPNLADVDAENLYEALIATPVTNLTPTYDSGTSTLTLTTTATGAGIYLGFTTDATVATKWGWTIGVPGQTTGSAGTSGLPTVKFSAIEEGSWANGAIVTIVANTNDAAKRDITISTSHPGIPAETFSGVNIANLATFQSGTWLLEDLASTNTAPTNLPQVGSYVLGSGDDGITGLTQGNLLGSETSNTGVYPLYENQDFLDVFIPELTDNTSQIILKNVGEDRGTYMHLSFPSTVVTVSQAIDFRRQEGAYAAGTIIDSTYVSFHFGQLSYLNSLTNDTSTRNYENLGGLAGVLSYNDSVNVDKVPGPWLTAAGPKRGATDAFSATPNLSGASNATLDSMASDQVNWFALQSGEVVANGNRTGSSDLTSLLQWANVRRYLLSLRLEISPTLRSAIYEPHDPVLWRSVYKDLVAILETHKNNRAIFEYSVECDQNARNLSDAVLNTTDMISAGILVVEIRVKPIPGVDSITVKVEVSRLSATFTEV